MLGVKQRRQLGQKIQFQLSRDSLGHVVAELALAHASLHDGCKSFGQRDADLLRSTKGTQVAHWSRWPGLDTLQQRLPLLGDFTQVMQACQLSYVMSGEEAHQLLQA